MNLVEKGNGKLRESQSTHFTAVLQPVTQGQHKEQFVVTAQFLSDKDQLKAFGETEVLGAVWLLCDKESRTRRL